MSDDESHDGCAVDDRPERRFEPVHRMDVADVHERERGEHHDADAAPEITAISGDDELDEPHERERACRMVRSRADDDADAIAECEEHRRESEKIWDEPSELLF